MSPTTPAGPSRCPWCLGSPDYIRYHDEEWGVPLHGDDRLFEMLTLEGAQAGLSWLTVLRKREGYRRAFRGFDIARVAAMTAGDEAALLQDPGIIRNRLKIASTVRNARAALALIAELGSLDAHLWSFVGGRPTVNARRALAEIPASSPESDAMARDLKKRGFNFVGTTICYAFMQASGMVDDHLVTCFRHPRATPDSPRKK